eukprot:Lithocolla_globosa_v1_NODE_3137_length_1755_cov_9.637647.p2 type:complete len:138 gc:universal NODE_3137_length_1755_cov_9.637647:256-669(+)
MLSKTVSIASLGLRMVAANRGVSGNLVVGEESAPAAIYKLSQIVGCQSLHTAVTQEALLATLQVCSWVPYAREPWVFLTYNRIRPPCDTLVTFYIQDSYKQSATLLLLQQLPLPPTYCPTSPPHPPTYRSPTDPKRL